MCADTPPAAATRNMRSISDDGRARRVRATEAHGHGSLRQTFAKDGFHRRHLRVGGRSAAADAGRQEPFTGIAQHLHPRRDVADRHAVVDDLSAFTRLVPSRHVARAHLQLEGRGDAVAHHHPVRLLLLAVLVKVDEAGRDDVARRVDDSRTRERCCRHCLDLAAPDAHVPDTVEARFRIHHAAVGDHQVVGGGRLARTRREDQRCSRSNQGVPHSEPHPKAELE